MKLTERSEKSPCAGKPGYPMKRKHKGDDALIACPHFKITFRQRSKGQSAVAGAAYQSGEKLFSAYDQKTKNYRYKASEVLAKGILLPPNAPREYADRQTLWNAAEAEEKQWNSQLSRGIVTLIEKILIHEPLKLASGLKEQEIEIYYRFVGKIE